MCVAYYDTVAAMVLHATGLMCLVGLKIRGNTGKDEDDGTLIYELLTGRSSRIVV
jgi:hypothetical protein